MIPTRYEILHDNGKPICFIGKSYYNRMIMTAVMRERTCEQISLEEVSQKDRAWFNERQFFFTFASVAFKRQVVAAVSKFSPHYVTFVDSVCSISDPGNIGRNCAFSGAVFVADDAVIGDHVFMAPCLISHESRIGDFSFLAPWSYVAFSDLGQGGCLGTGSKLIGKSHRRLRIADWCSFYANSCVTRSIAVSATYSSHDKVSDHTSLTNNIL